jgi:plastocyanin
MALQKRFLSLMMVVFLGLAGALVILEAYQRPKAEITKVNEIILIAKGMAYNTDNPPLILKLGQPVRIIIINEDKGMLHDFVIEELDVSTSGPLEYGQTEVINFVPTKKGKYEYFCSYHAKMMRGKVIIKS